MMFRASRRADGNRLIVLTCGSHNLSAFCWSLAEHYEPNSMRMLHMVM